MNLPTTLCNAKSSAQVILTPFSLCSPFDLQWLPEQFRRISEFGCQPIGGDEGYDLSDDESGKDQVVVIPVDLPVFKVVDRRQSGGNGEAERRYREEGLHDGGSLEFEDKVILISTLKLPNLSEKTFKLLSYQLGRLMDYGKAIYVIITNPNVENAMALFGSKKAETLFFKKVQHFHPNKEIISITL